MAEGISKTFDKLMAQRIANEERARRGGGFNTRDFLKQLIPVGLKFATNVTNNILSERLENYMQNGPALSAMQVARMADENTKAYNLETTAIGTKSERDYYMELIKPQLIATLKTTKTKDGQFISSDTRAFDALVRQRAGFIADQLVERRKALGQLINAEPPTEGSYENLVDLASRRARPQTVTNYISSAAKNFLTGKTREDAEIEAMAAFSDFNQPVDPSDGFTEGERAVAINNAMEAFKETRNLVYSIDFGNATAEGRKREAAFRDDLNRAPTGKVTERLDNITIGDMTQTVRITTTTDVDGNSSVKTQNITLDDRTARAIIKKDYARLHGVAVALFKGTPGEKYFSQRMLGMTEDPSTGNILPPPEGTERVNMTNPTERDYEILQKAFFDTVAQAQNFGLTDLDKARYDVLQSVVTAVSSQRLQQLVNQSAILSAGINPSSSDTEIEEYRTANILLGQTISDIVSEILEQGGLRIDSVDDN
jgi:hypothetical protein